MILENELYDKIIKRVNLITSTPNVYVKEERTEGAPVIGVTCVFKDQEDLKLQARKAVANLNMHFGSRIKWIESGRAVVGDMEIKIEVSGYYLWVSYNIISEKIKDLNGKKLADFVEKTYIEALKIETF